MNFGVAGSLSFVRTVLLSCTQGYVNAKGSADKFLWGDVRRKTF